MKFELTFDVAEHGTCAKAEKMRFEPRVAEFFFHQPEPLNRLLGRFDSSGRFKAHRDSSLLRKFTNHSRHDQANRQRGIYRLLSRGGFDEIGASHHCNKASLCHISKSQQISRAKNDLKVSRAACVFEGDDFVIEFLPFRAEYMRTCYDHVNFLSASRNGAANFRNSIFKR